FLLSHLCALQPCHLAFICCWRQRVPLSCRVLQRAALLTHQIIRSFPVVFPSPLLVAAFLKYAATHTRSPHGNTNAKTAYSLLQHTRPCCTPRQRHRRRCQKRC